MAERMNLRELFASLTSMDDGPEVEVELTPESPMIIMGSEVRTLCLKRDVGIAVQYSVDQHKGSVVVGAGQSLSIVIPSEDEVAEFLTHATDNKFTTFAEYAASDMYLYKTLRG